MKNSDEHRYEYFGTPEGEVMIIENGAARTYVQEDLAFTTYMIEKIKNLYSEAYKALTTIYQKSALNRTYYEFLIVRRFINCNFSKLDNIPDLDEEGAFHFEFVPCPLRAECKYCNIICNAKMDTSLSACEKEIMKLYLDGKKSDEIADMLFKSIHTVRTHKRNAYQKLGVSSTQEFFAYVKKNNLFNNK